MSAPADSKRRYAIAWLILIAATLFSFEVLQQSGSHSLATRIVLGVAAVKAAIVGLEFMELRISPLWLRNLFLGWIVVIGSVLAALLSF